jgi:hypothetical protein
MSGGGGAVTVGVADATGIGVLVAPGMGVLVATVVGVNVGVAVGGVKSETVARTSYGVELVSVHVVKTEWDVVASAKDESPAGEPPKLIEVGELHEEKGPVAVVYFT